MLQLVFSANLNISPVNTISAFWLFARDYHT